MCYIIFGTKCSSSDYNWQHLFQTGVQPHVDLLSKLKHRPQVCERVIVQGVHLKKKQGLGCKCMCPRNANTCCCICVYLFITDICDLKISKRLRLVNSFSQGNFQTFLSSAVLLCLSLQLQQLTYSIINNQHVNVNTWGGYAKCSGKNKKYHFSLLLDSKIEILMMRQILP